MLTLPRNRFSRFSSRVTLKPRMSSWGVPPVVDFTNVLKAAITHKDPKSTKRHWWLDCLFGIWANESCTLTCWWNWPQLPYFWPIFSFRCAAKFVSECHEMKQIEKNALTHPLTSPGVHFTNIFWCSLYMHRSQKFKKDCWLDCIFCAFGIFVRKSFA